MAVGIRSFSVSVVIALTMASWVWAVQEEGGNVGVWFGKGEELRLAGQLDQALPFYDKCVAADPHHYSALMASGTILYRLGRFENAAERFGTAAKVRPSDPRALLNLGHAKLKLDDVDGAKAAFMSLLALDSKNVPALIGLGTSRYLSGKWYTALDSFKKALELQPKNRALKRTVARVEQAINDRAELTEAERASAARGAMSAAFAEAAAQSRSRQSGSAGSSRAGGAAGGFDLFEPQPPAAPLVPIPNPPKYW
ncbi:MAG: tetratricopeptide repeat protein [Pseudomonadota bacterium]